MATASGGCLRIWPEVAKRPHKPLVPSRVGTNWDSILFEVVDGFRLPPRAGYRELPEPARFVTFASIERPPLERVTTPSLLSCFPIENGIL